MTKPGTKPETKPRTKQGLSVTGLSYKEQLSPKSLLPRQYNGKTNTIISIASARYRPNQAKRQRPYICHTTAGKVLLFGQPD